MIYNKENESIKKTIKSTMLIMLVPFISSIIIFLILILSNNKYIKENENMEFGSIINYFENDFDSLINFSGKLIYNESYHKVYSLNDYHKLLDEDYLIINEYLKLMRDKVSFIDHVILVFPSGFYISDMGANKIEYLSTEFEYYLENIDEAYERLNNQESGISFTIKNNNQMYGSLKLFDQGINLDIILLSNNNTIKAYLNEVCNLREDGYFYLSSNTGYLFGMEVNNSENTLSKKIVNKFSKVYIKNSDKSNLKYYYYISKSNYRSLNILVYGLSIFSILSCLLFFFILVNSIYKNKYAPLIKIKERLDDLKLGNDKMSDEELIRKIEELKIDDDEKDKIDILSKRYMVNETFRRLLKSIPLDYEMDDILEKYNFNLKNRNIISVIIKSNAFNELIDDLKKRNLESEVPYLLNKRVSLIKEYFKSFDEVIIVEEEKEIVVILSTSLENDDEVIDNAKECSKNYQKKIRDEYSIDTLIAIGTVVKEIKRINESYKKALSTREFIDLLGATNEITSYYDLYDNGTLSIDILPYKDLRDMIRLKDFEKAKEQTIYVIDKEIISNDKKELMIKMYSFIDRLNTEISGALFEYSPEFIKELDVTGRLMKVESIKELKDTTNQIFNLIIKNQDSKIDDEFGWIEKVKDYIRLNYKEKSLSVSSLADEFHFSLSYFSRMFKIKTGYGISEFINEVRIDEAKSLLKKGMTVMEVAENCGFLDSRSLIRTFKSFYGETPSKYKIN